MRKNDSVLQQTSSFILSLEVMSHELGWDLKLRLSICVRPPTTHTFSVQRGRKMPTIMLDSTYCDGA